MGNSSREVPSNSSAVFNYIHSQASGPASPMKSPPVSSPSFSYDYNRLSQFETAAGRRHSVAGDTPPVVLRDGIPILHGNSSSVFMQPSGPRRRNVIFEKSDMIYYELDDMSDDSSTSTSSPQVHRKMERSRSEPKAPPGLLNMMDLQQNQHSNRYKTELCRAFSEAGHCKYGEKCQFAHGQPEIRLVTRHPKYKTEYCRSFHATGFCDYGQRCHFIHNPADMQPQQHSRKISTCSMNDAGAKVVPTTARTGGGSGTIVNMTSSVQAGNAVGRPRAISLSAFPHPIPIAHGFIADQLRQMGSCGNSLNTVSSIGSTGSYSSSPLSMSPGIGENYGGWCNDNRFCGSSNISDMIRLTLAYRFRIGMAKLDRFRRSTELGPPETEDRRLPPVIDGFGSGLDGEAPGPWAFALAHLLSDME